MWNVFAIFKAFLVIIFLSVSNGNIKDVKVKPQFTILQREAGASSSTLGVAGGLRHCGGPGKVIQNLYESCNGEYPCKVPGDGKNRRGELEFIPSVDIAALGLRVNIITDKDEETRLDHPMSNSTVIAGHTYRCAGYGGVKEEMIGQQVTFQWILYQVENNNVEVCAEIDYMVVEPEGGKPI